MSVPAPEILPIGMVPWAGGDSAPADWDGGPVLRRRSNVRGGYSLGNAGHADWWKRHEIRGNRHLTDIIAYTPRTAATGRRPKMTPRTRRILGDLAIVAAIVLAFWGMRDFW